MSGRLSGAGTEKVEYRELLSLKEDMMDMKKLMSSLVETVSRLTLIEERQNTMAQATNKATERMETIAQRQHAAELASVGTQSLAERVGLVEKAFLDLHVEGERNKAKFQTFVWMLRALWAVIGILGGGAIVWLPSVVR